MNIRNKARHSLGRNEWHIGKEYRPRSFPKPPDASNGKYGPIVAYHYALPYLQTNPYITEGYRMKLSKPECFQSLFWWTNETLNIWTHMLGFCLFIYLFCYDLSVEYSQYKVAVIDIFIASFVLLCFMVCMILSSLYHLLNCYSVQYCKWWFSLDIFGISLTIFAIFISGIYYGFWCHEHLYLRLAYIGCVCLIFFLAVTFLLIPRFMGSEWSWVRITVFGLWALSGIIPTLHWVSLCGGMQVLIVKLFLPRILNMYIISGFALIIYIFRIPESLLPGRFNYIGASHQLWHVIIVGALFYWHQSGLAYAKFHEEFGCAIKI